MTISRADAKITHYRGADGDVDEPAVNALRTQINAKCVFLDTSEDHGFVKARTTAAIDSAGGATWTLASGVYTNDANGALSTQDGQTMVAGDRLAIMDGIDVGAGTDLTYNGLVTVTTLGTASVPAVLTQVSGWDTGDDVALFKFTVDKGTTHEDREFRVTNDKGSGVIGTDTIAFEIYGGPGSVQTADITDSAVTLAKIVDMAADGLLGNDSGGAAAPQALTVAEANTLLNVATTTAPGTVEIATTAEVDTGTDDVRAISSLALAGSAPALLVSAMSVAAKTITVTDDDSAATNGTDLYAQIYQGEITFWSANAGSAPSDFDNTDNSDGWYVGFNADPVTNYGAVAVYFDEDGTAGSRVLFVSPLARDVYAKGFNGRLLKLTHDASAASNGVAVHFDDNGASKEARLLFISPTDTAGADNLPTSAGRIGIA